MEPDPDLPPRHNDTEQTTEDPGELSPGAGLSYPCAVEHEGKLYVGYSNSAGRHGNHNSAELAIIPLSALRVE